VNLELPCESRVTPGLRENSILETSYPGVNSVTCRKLARHHRQGNLGSKLGASKMTAHFDEDNDDSIISSAAYSY